MQVLDTKVQIKAFRLLTLLKGLELEIKGMQLSRGKSCYHILKKEFAFKGSKKTVLLQYQKLLVKWELIETPKGWN